MVDDCKRKHWSNIWWQGLLHYITEQDSLNQVTASPGDTRVGWTHLYSRQRCRWTGCPDGPAHHDRGAWHTGGNTWLYTCRPQKRTTLPYLLFTLVKTKEELKCKTLTTKTIPLYFVPGSDVSTVGALHCVKHLGQRTQTWILLCIDKGNRNWHLSPVLMKPAQRSKQI